jgi:hypothetical protein
MMDVFPAPTTEQLSVMAATGWGATQWAQVNAFSRYQHGKSENTLKNHFIASELWAGFLNAAAGEMYGQNGAVVFVWSRKPVVSIQ